MGVGIFALFALCLSGCGYTCYILGLRDGSADTLDYLEANGMIEFAEEDE